jgi:hypothetical protein
MFRRALALTILSAGISAAAFAQPASVVGDRFAIMLSNTGGSCGVWPAAVSPDYLGGTGWLDANDGPIVPLSLSGLGDDIPFRTIMRVR